MKVKELIKELQKIENQDLEISVVAENGLFFAPRIKGVRDNPLEEVKEYVLRWD